MPNAAPTGERDSQVYERLGTLKTITARLPDPVVTGGKSRSVEVIGLKGMTPVVLLAEVKEVLFSRAISSPPGRGSGERLAPRDTRSAGLLSRGAAGIGLDARTRGRSLGRRHCARCGPAEAGRGWTASGSDPAARLRAARCAIGVLDPLPADWARRLVERGFVVLLSESFASRG
jgi:hypothetical protein